MGISTVLLSLPRGIKEVKNESRVVSVSRVRRRRIVDLVMSALDRYQTDCIIARLKCCGGIVFVVVNDTHVTKKDREEIGALAASGLAIEHLTVAEVRKKKWGCKCTHSEGKS